MPDEIKHKFNILQKRMNDMVVMLAEPSNNLPLTTHVTQDFMIRNSMLTANELWKKLRYLIRCMDDLMVSFFYLFVLIFTMNSDCCFILSIDCIK